MDEFNSTWSNFDIVDDSMDIEEYSANELDQYFQIGYLKPMMADAYDNSLYVDDNVKCPLLLAQKHINSQAPGQSHCQIDRNDHKRTLHSTPSNSQSPVKKKRHANERDGNNAVLIEPEALHNFIQSNNPWFENWIAKNMDLVESLGLHIVQNIMHIQYQIEYYEIQRRIYQLYSQSGNGTLIVNEPNLFANSTVDRCHWPRQLIDAMYNKRATTISFVPTNPEACINHIRRETEKIELSIEKCRAQLKQLFTTRKDDLTFDLEEKMQDFVFDYGLKPLYMKRDLKTDLLYHDYRLVMLQRSCDALLVTSPEKQTFINGLCEMKYDVERARRDLIESKQHVFYQKPPHNIQMLDSDIYCPTISNNNEQERLLQIDKVNAMLDLLRKQEENYYDKYRNFENEYAKIKDMHLTPMLTSILERRLSEITNRMRRIYDFRLKFYLATSYDDQQRRITERVTFGPSMIIRTDRRLTKEQQQLLSRGPSYNTPCQRIFDVDSKISSKADHLKQKFTPMKSQLARAFDILNLDISSRILIDQELQKKFDDFFSVPTSSHMSQRISYEIDLIDSIRKIIKDERLVLRRTSDNQNQFYLGNAVEYDEECNRHIVQMNFIQEISNLSHTDDDDSSANENHDAEVFFNNELQKLIYKINRTLEKLHMNGTISRSTVDKIQLTSMKFEMPILYFLPNIVSSSKPLTVAHQFGMNNNPTHKIGRYLQRLMKPFVDRSIQSLTFQTPINFIENLKKYISNGKHFKSSTLFCHMTISNFFNMADHATMINVVGAFIEEQSAYNTIGKHSIAAIQQLLSIFLENNHFRYKQKLYTFSKGSPSNIPLSTTLSNIYVHLWQQFLFRMFNRKDEFFGCYKDQLLFTYNGPVEQLERSLKKLQIEHPNVEFDFEIAKHASFIGAYIENRDGKLYTRIDNGSSLQPHSLPYVTGHNKQKYSDWLRSSLNRAVCYCTSLDDFHRERLRLEFALLANGYSLLFVERHMHHFFDYFQHRDMRFSNDVKLYEKFRVHWFTTMNQRYSQTGFLKTLEEQGNILRFDYFYDFGNRTEFNRYFLKFWSDYLEKHHVTDKDKYLFVIAAKQASSLNTLLGRYRWLE